MSRLRIKDEHTKTYEVSLERDSAEDVWVLINGRRVLAIMDEGDAKLSVFMKREYFECGDVVKSYAYIREEML